MLSAPATVGVKLIAVAKLPPPVKVEEHPPVVLSVAVAVELDTATNVADAAGFEEQPASLTIVLTGLRIAEGLIAVPTGDTGTLTLSRVICPSVSPPPELITVEYCAKYRLPCASRESVFAPWVDTIYKAVG